MSKHKKAIHYSAATLAAQALGHVDAETKAVVLPIHISTTYLRDADNSYPEGRIYSRADNPSYKPTEQLLTALEEGSESLLFASGMAAATAVFQTLKPGDHVLAPTIMYWALRNWLQTFSKQWQVEVEFVDMGNLTELRERLRANTALVWIETPGNPLWCVTDIAAVAELAHNVNARLAVDSTCATPLLTKPLKLGADIVMHSATKYLNGHSDVIAGALVTAQQDDWWQAIRAVRSQQGAVPSPRDAVQVLRGMRTLHLRVRESCENALFLAQQLEQNPLVTEVLYPGLPSFADHELAKRQMQGGFGGMLSIRVKAGMAAAITVAAQTQLWKRATSLGGVESLIEHRASIEGVNSPIPTDLLRLSAGIEDKHELLADLEQALTIASN